MRTIKKFILYIGLLFVSVSAFAQAETDSIVNDTTITTKLSSKLPLAIGVSASTNGIGGWVSTAFNNRFGLRLGFEKMEININEFDFDLNGQDLAITPNIQSGGISLMADFYALKWLYLSTGFVYSFMDFSAVATSGSPIVVGDITLTPNDIGELTVGIEPDHRFSPCITIGLGRNIASKKRLAFSLEMGAYFMGAYQVNMSGTKLFEANGDPANIQPLNDALRDISWSGVYPIIKLGLSYRLF